MEASYLFYDIETTGINPCFDQVLQFAAIRTDLSLNEIDRYECMVQLNCDVTPNPKAMQIHGISLEEIAAGKKEIDAIQKIHRLINHPGTISLGYNTLGFDDGFLRFSFYRNLLPPYTHQYANHCGRMDIYPMTLLYYLFSPDILQWPSSEGHVSFKLENINTANHFVQGQSHHAMVDVEVTLALAKALHSNKTMWNYLAGYFVKKTDTERIMKFKTAFDHFRLGIVADGRIGSAKNFLAPALHLGQHRIYKNQNVWLRLDDTHLVETKPDAIAETTFIVRKKAGESPIMLPFEDRFLEKIGKTRRTDTENNLQHLQKNKALLSSITDYYLNDTYPEVKNVDADAALYHIPFPTTEEESLFREFHQATPEKKQSIMEIFPSAIRKEQALRILGRHYPEVLSEENQALFQDYLQRIKNGVVDYRGQTREHAAT